ncbi:MAG: hypothetical protein ACW98D_17910 [Promethearchaeota archaeon]|jgi:hypothetical protein
MNIEMEIAVDKTIEECKGFYTKKTVGQFIYTTMRAIDELEEVANPTNYQAEELEEQYKQLDELVAIRKKMFNI